MRTVRRMLGAALGLAGLTGTILCVAGIAGCWVVRAEAVARTDRAFDRVTGGLDAARVDLTRALAQVEHTREELKDLRRRESPAAVPEGDRGTAGRPRRRQVTDDAAAKLDELRRIAARATEAALVFEGFMNALDELRVTDRIGIDAEPLRDATDRLSEAAGIARRLSDRFAPTAPDTTEPKVDQQSDRLDEVLSRTSRAIGAGVGRLETARDRTDDARKRLVRAFTVAACGWTLLMVWVGAGQMGLVARALGRP